MTAATILNLIGLILGLAGSGLLAISLNRFLRMLRLAVEAHEISIGAMADSIIRGGAMPVFQGFDKQLARASRFSGRLTVIGFTLLAMSFASQLLGLAVSLPP